MDKQPRRLLVFLNLAQIRFPIGAIASIAHRVSGVLLFIALPVLAALLDASLRSEAGFASVRGLLSSPLSLVVPVCWRGRSCITCWPGSATC